MIFSSDLERRAARWVAPVSIMLAGSAMVVWTWQTWADVTIDFGRELYVPWQMTEGKVLYRDIAYFNGPFSPCVNYVWFRLFGVSIRTLVLCNLVILAGLVWLTRALFLRVAGPLAATSACLVLLIGFSFGQPNYNFVCPYSHDLTHGIVLSTAAIFCINCYGKNRKVSFAAGAGLMLGLAFLTKPEVFAAAAPAVILGLALTLQLERPLPRRRAAVLASFVVAALAPVLAAFALLGRVMETRDAWRGVLGGWAFIFNEELRRQPFYRNVMGASDIEQSLLAISRAMGWQGLFFLCVAGLAFALRKQATYRAWIAAGLFCLPAVYILRRLALSNLVRPMPVVMLALGAACCAALLKSGLSPEARQRMVVRMMLATFGLVLLAKILFKVQVAHYGFALAMPAALLSTVTVLDWIPALIARIGGSGAVFRAGSLALLLLAGTDLLRGFERVLNHKTYAVGSGSDLIRTDGRAHFINRLLEEIQRRLSPKDTLLVLPEGVMLNYLSRRVNPPPYINFMPPELIMFGEETMLAAFKAHPPDYVVLLHKDTSEYELPYFGEDYGREIYRWVTTHYSPVKLWGDLPFQSSRFGIRLLKRGRAE
jgi:hypothetical protein